MTDYPTMIATVNHMEPVPRRIRATVGAHTILDTTHAVYLWEWPNYPQYYIPLADLRPELIVDGQPGSRRTRRSSSFPGIPTPGLTRSGPPARYGWNSRN